MIRLDRARPFGYAVTDTDTGADILVQLDYDYPGLASTFGWDIRTVGAVTLECDHDGTDGTIPCPSCGTPAVAFIESAADYLDTHDGATADDPGYFVG